MSKIFFKRQQNLYLKHTKDKGRGVFSTKRITAGTLLEVAPALILNESDTDTVDDTLILSYAFSVGALSARLRKKYGIKNTDKCSAIVMGVGSFCNHSESPNATIEWEEQDGTVYYQLKATKTIKPGEEICTSYGSEWFNSRRR